MRPRPPRSKRTDTLFPYTTLFRSIFSGAGIGIAATLHPSFMKAHNAPHIWEGDKMRGIFQLSGGASMGASAAAIVAMAMASPAMAQKRSFNVPAQNAARAIPEFARQAGIQIVASGVATPGHTTDAVQGSMRSEEHTSELQSLMRISYAVFCLKKKKQHMRKQHNV